MNIKRNQPIGVVSWLATLKGTGYVASFYEPDTVLELENLCADFFSKGLVYDLIGHTSNTLYTPDYVCERMVSTRKLNHFEIKDDCIVCECGTSVRALSLAAVDAGIKGFEGLTDLPGTVAAAVYGNAGCYDCSVSRLLKEAIVLCHDGTKKKVEPEWFGFSKRSSVLKRGEKKAVILSLVLRREDGDIKVLKEVAERNHANRRATQPEPKNSLGSIFANSGSPTLLNRILSLVSRLYVFLLKLLGNNEQQIKVKKKIFIFTLLGARDIVPYVRTWNWFQWRDEQAYMLFWKYVRLHRRLFTKSDFEIEIKHNNSFEMPLE